MRRDEDGGEAHCGAAASLIDPKKTFQVSNSEFFEGKVTIYSLFYKNCSYILNFNRNTRDDKV